METWYEQFHGLLRLSHIVAGFAGLVLFWLVIVFPKGTALHRAIGNGFVYAALYVGGTGLLSSVWALAHVESFFPGLTRMAEGRQAIQREQLRFLFSLLGFLSAATVTGAIFGKLSIKYGANLIAFRRSSLPFWKFVTAAMGLGLVDFGGMRIMSGSPAGGMPVNSYWILVVLGGLGFVGAIRDLQRIYSQSCKPREWLQWHVSQMFGTGIAFHTAFLVFGANRMLKLSLRGPLAILPWILPTIIGVIAIKWYLRRLEGAHPTAPEPLSQVSE